MEKFSIRIFDRDMNVIYAYEILCVFFEEAEQNAQRYCDMLLGHTWDVRYAN